MISSIALALLLLAPGTDRGFRPARVQLSGPLTEVVFRIGDEDVTHFVGTLTIGEERELVVPFPMTASNREPVVRVVGAGAVTFEGWLTDEDELALPRLLAHRTRPPVVTAELRVPPVAMLLLVASGILALGLRRRPWHALAASAVLGLAAGALTVQGSASGSQAEQLLEGDSREERWLLVETALGQLSCGANLPARVEISPAGRPVHWSVTLGPDGEPRYLLEARAATLLSVRSLPVTGGPIDRGQNQFIELSESWIRAETGGFRAHGPWKLGMPLPEPLDGAGSSPPGWLASGLPQGIPVLLGRVADRRTLQGVEAVESGGAEAPTWLRLTAFY